MEVKFTEQQKGLLSNYVENKEVADQIISVIAENQLTAKEVEEIFNVILDLFDRMPAVPAEIQINV